MFVFVCFYSFHPLILQCLLISVLTPFYFSARNKIQQAHSPSRNESSEARLCHELTQSLGFSRHCRSMYVRNCYFSRVCACFVLLLQMHQAHRICILRQCLKVRSFVYIKSWNSFFDTYDQIVICFVCIMNTPLYYYRSNKPSIFWAKVRVLIDMHHGK